MDNVIRFPFAERHRRIREANVKAAPQLLVGGRPGFAFRLRPEPSGVVITVRA